MRLKDKIAIVTGGGTGIGKSITESFVKEGARVMICSRNLENLNSTAKSLNNQYGEEKVFALSVNVNKKEEVESSVAEVIQKWGEVHILVNNAGRSGRLPLLESTDEEWLDILDTNLNGIYFFSKAVLRSMKDQSHGRIINISSVLGKFGVAGYTAYSASKHGVVGFSSALALEVAPRGITVNTICPGWVETQMASQGIQETAKALNVSTDEFRKMAINAIPIKRFVALEEVAELAIFLSGEEARAITGQAINICGGSVMH
ncbi:MAG: SDR family oxidoreductase [Nitrospirae bacterium]|nr:SDR family oxidoreductase [Nitrospirota bacterium]MBI3593535.1 SDR family oxidoreductase [Nitrospirota bacterium]